MSGYFVAFAAGTLLSGLAAALMAFTDPYASLPRLSRNLWADYRALSGAPAGSVIQVFAVSAVIYAACFLAAGVLARHRDRVSQPPELPGPDHEDRSVSC